MYSGHVLEHGSSRPGRWLRTHRLRITFWVALVEALLVVLHVLSWWAVVLLAALAVAVWWYSGRRSRSDLLRQGSWIAAVSQLLVTMVPVVLFVATTIAIAVVVLFAIAALVFLFTERT
jgi:hypothetical protein